MKIINLLILITMLTSFNSIRSYAREKVKVLIITNPTVNILTNFRYLIENKIIDVPHLKIIGLYNSYQKYDFKESEDYIKTSQMNYVELKGIPMNISNDSLFSGNSCSSIFHELFIKSDGIIFTGGEDIPPELYHTKTSLLTSSMPFERLYELSFMFHLISRRQGQMKPFLAERQDYLVFGICLGMQEMNVACGGTLYQDIPLEIYHTSNAEDVLKFPGENIHRNYLNNIQNSVKYAGSHFHSFLADSNSFLFKVSDLKKNPGPKVASSHHQCIRETGNDLKIAAVSTDGKIIEAIEHKVYRNVVGVQFHPEYKYIYDISPDLLIEPGITAHENVTETDIRFNKAIWNYISGLLISN